MIFATQAYKTERDEQLARMRTDFEGRLAEKDAEIRSLRIALDRGSVRIEPEPVPMRIREVQAEQKPDGPLDWQGELSQLLQEEEGKADGVHE